MASSVEAGKAWSTMEDVMLCKSWGIISHDSITGNEMKFAQMWKKIHAEFVERTGSNRTESGLQSRWKTLNRELTQWKQAKSLAAGNIQSGTNRTDELLQAHGWFKRETKKRFTHHECWEVVKVFPKFKIIPHPGANVVLNDTPLHGSVGNDSSMDSPISMDSSPVEPMTRPVGKKKAKKGGTSIITESAKFLEQIAIQGAMSLERDIKRDEADRLRDESLQREREYTHKQEQDKRDREVMSMNASAYSPDTQQYWREERRDVMRRRRLFREDGPSNMQDGPGNTDWLNQDN